MRNTGVDVDPITQALGHSSLHVTREYFENLDEWAAEQFDRAEGKVIRLGNRS